MKVKKIVTGNEAAAIGAYENGVAVATGYPGAPCTQILEHLAQYEEIYCEWSINEKVAMEVAIGASFSGKRSFVVMKTLGLNVAADALLQYSGTKVNGGLVLVVADDVGRIVGDDYQDSRNYGIAAHIPVLEPGSCAEIRQFIKAGFELSEEYSTPVIVRLNAITTKSKGIIDVETDLEVKKPVHHKYDFCGQKMATNVIRFGFHNHDDPQLKKYWHNFAEDRQRLAEDCNDLEVNRLELTVSKIGIIASGVSYYYAKEVMPNASYLKLGLAYPLPTQLIHTLAESVEELYVIEGFQPLLEKEIKALGISVKGTEIFPRFPEGLYFTPDLIEEKILGQQILPKCDFREQIPFRMPTNCPGCSHLFIFNVLAKHQIKASGSIGCGGLGALPHIGEIDIVQCMGSSIGIAHGWSKATADQRFVAITGDGEFWHTGINNLLNSVYNQGNTTTIIVDNLTTAMTGGQGNPSSGYGLGQKVTDVSIDEVCQALGVTDLSIVDPYNYEGLEKSILNALDYQGPSVIIARRPCLTFGPKSEKKRCVVTERCVGCKKCTQIGCLAIELTEQGLETLAKINEHLCIGCGLCKEVCKIGAINDV